MNWHTKEDWTGYTFDDSLFAEPKDLFDWLHSKGLAVAANLHDADGVACPARVDILQCGLPADTDSYGAAAQERERQRQQRHWWPQRQSPQQQRHRWPQERRAFSVGCAAADGM